jgi:hypothetical protein
MQTGAWGYPARHRPQSLRRQARVRRGLPLPCLYHGNGCARVASGPESAWEAQGVRPPLAAGLFIERRCLPGLRTVRFRLSGKGDHLGSVPLAGIFLQTIPSRVNDPRQQPVLRYFVWCALWTSGLREFWRVLAGHIGQVRLANRIIYWLQRSSPICLAHAPAIILRSDEISGLVRFLPVGSHADIDGERHIERRDAVHQCRQLAFYGIDFGLWHFKHEFVMHLHDQTAPHAGC